MTKRGKILTYILLSVVSVFSAFPLVWMAISATNASIDVIKGTLLPGTYLIENFKELTRQINLGQGMYNSFRNSLLLTTLSVLINSVAGYAFEVYHDRVKDFVMMVLLLAMMVPFVAVMIPLFTMFSKMKMLNSLGALLIPSLAYPMLILMFRQAARSFPMEIIEAARVDGLSEVGIFIRMFFPTMRSTFGAAFTISFMGSWNSYLWPLVIFQKNETKTMPLLISTLQGQFSTDYGVLMLGVFLCTLPTALVFLFLQKSFAEGITGAAKG